MHGMSKPALVEGEEGDDLTRLGSWDDVPRHGRPPTRNRLRRQQSLPRKVLQQFLLHDGRPPTRHRAMGGGELIYKTSFTFTLERPLSRNSLRRIRKLWRKRRRGSGNSRGKVKAWARRPLPLPLFNREGGAEPWRMGRNRRDASLRDGARPELGPPTPTAKLQKTGRNRT